MLVYGRWAFTPLLLGAIGLFAVPLVCAVTTNWVISWKGQLLILLLVSLVLGGWNRWSARISPDEAFQLTFGQPIPPGITDVVAHKQYFDGFIVTLSFHASKTDLNSILKTRPYQPDTTRLAMVKSGQQTWADFWNSYCGTWVGIAHPGWPSPPAQATDLYSVDDSAKSFAPDFTHVFWNSQTGQTYVVYIL